ncbi:MAG: hypothetical protein WBP64_19580 [Nitrososphaeraceae archaeon]|jgi:hypothetical protein
MDRNSRFCQYLRLSFCIQWKSKDFEGRWLNKIMFSKAKCKLCGDEVRFALKHLRDRHPQTLKDNDVVKLKMSKILKKYFA